MHIASVQSPGELVGCDNWQCRILKANMLGSIAWEYPKSVAKEIAKFGVASCIYS